MGLSAVALSLHGWSADVLNSPARWNNEETRQDGQKDYVCLEGLIARLTILHYCPPIMYAYLVFPSFARTRLFALPCPTQVKPPSIAAQLLLTALPKDTMQRNHYSREILTRIS